MKAKEVMSYNINKLLRERGVSQAELARAINKEPLTIHHYVKGIRFPKPDNIDAICDYFKIPIMELFRQKEEVLTTIEAFRALAKSLGLKIDDKNLNKNI
jgi:transcriptional regulator with XRE-family HTH domain